MRRVSLELACHAQTLLPSARRWGKEWGWQQDPLNKSMWIASFVLYLKRWEVGATLAVNLLWG